MHDDALKPGSLPVLLVVLTITTGLIDAVSVLGLGRVFTANMTGNIVFLGFALARVPGFSLTRSLVALGAFLVGAVIGGRLGLRLNASQRRWFLIVAVVESSLLFAAALVAREFDSQTLVPVARLYALIALTAVAMGVRNATVRRLAVPDLTTTVLTLTLAGLGADSSLAGGSNPRWSRRIISVAAMLGGATLGGLLVLARGLVWPLALTGAITLSATLAYVARPATGEGI
ncbi:MAG TPA: YoaK family protein [Gemmatimonadales bacterium]|nr:YoaK family protein [Gemmatimonadales bacterium]